MDEKPPRDRFPVKGPIPFNGASQFLSSIFLIVALAATLATAASQIVGVKRFESFEVYVDGTGLNADCTPQTFDGETGTPASAQDAAELAAMKNVADAALVDPIIGLSGNGAANMRWTYENAAWGVLAAVGSPYCSGEPSGGGTNPVVVRRCNGCWADFTANTVKNNVICHWIMKYKDVGNKRYRLYDAGDATDYNSAKTFCESKSSGTRIARLATVGTAAEFAAVTQLTRNSRSSWNTNAWVGAKQDSGTWFWEDGSAFHDGTSCLAGYCPTINFGGGDTRLIVGNDLTLHRRPLGTSFRPMCEFLDVVEVGSIRFMYSRVQLSLDAASSACKRTSHSGFAGHLADVYTAADEAAVKSLAGWVGTDSWLGAHDRVEAGTFTWLNLFEFSAGSVCTTNAYCDWAGSEPSSTGNRGIVASSSTGWKASVATTQRGFLCVYRPKVPNTAKSHYVYLPLASPQTRGSAQHLCRHITDGHQTGSLANIFDGATATAMQTVGNTYSHTHMWLGGSDAGTPGTWTWTGDSAVFYYGGVCLPNLFCDWDPSEPKVSAGDDYTVFKVGTATLLAEAASYTAHVMCELFGTATASMSVTPSPSHTWTLSPSDSGTLTLTPPPTPTSTSSATPSQSLTATREPTASFTLSRSPSATRTASSSWSESRTSSNQVTVTYENTASISVSSSLTSSGSPSPSVTVTPPPTRTSTFSISPAPTSSESLTLSQSPPPTRTATASPSGSRSFSFSASLSLSFSRSHSVSAGTKSISTSSTLTPSSTATAPPSDTESETLQPTPTLSFSDTPTPSAAWTWTPTTSATPSYSHTKEICSPEGFDPSIEPLLQVPVRLSDLQTQGVSGNFTLTVPGDPYVSLRLFSVVHAWHPRPIELRLSLAVDVAAGERAAANGLSRHQPRFMNATLRYDNVTTFPAPILLSFEVAPVPGMDIALTERATLRVNRADLVECSSTFWLPILQLVVEPPEDEVIEDTKTAEEVVTATTMGVTIATGTSSVIDQQTIAVIGMLSCSDPYERQMFGSYRLLAPTATSESFAGVIYGNMILIGCVTLMHYVALRVSYKLRADELPWVEACAAVRFPSLEFKLAMLVYQGTAFAAAQLLVGSDDVWENILGFFALVACVAYPVALVVYAKKRIEAQYYTYDYSESPYLERNKWVPRPVVWFIFPKGRWFPTEVRKRFGGYVSWLGRREHVFTSYVFWSPLVMTAAALFRPSSDAACGAMFATAAAFQFLIAILCMLFMPYRAIIASCLQHISTVCIGIILSGSAATLITPDSTVGRTLVTKAAQIQMAVALLRMLHGVFMYIMDVKFLLTTKSELLFVWQLRKSINSTLSSEFEEVLLPDDPKALLNAQRFNPEKEFELKDLDGMDPDVDLSDDEDPFDIADMYPEGNHSDGDNDIEMTTLGGASATSGPLVVPKQGELVRSAGDDLDSVLQPSDEDLLFSSSDEDPFAEEPKPSPKGSRKERRSEPRDVLLDESVDSLDILLEESSETNSGSGEKGSPKTMSGSGVDDLADAPQPSASHDGGSFAWPGMSDLREAKDDADETRRYRPLLDGGAAAEDATSGLLAARRIPPKPSASAAPAAWDPTAGATTLAGAAKKDTSYWELPPDPNTFASKVLERQKSQAAVSSPKNLLPPRRHTAALETPEGAKTTNDATADPEATDESGSPTLPQVAAPGSPQHQNPDAVDVDEDVEGARLGPRNTFASMRVREFIDQGLFVEPDLVQENLDDREGFL